MKGLLFFTLSSIAISIMAYLGFWYAIAIVPFILAWFFQLKPSIGFVLGAASTFITWFIAMLFKDIPNNHLLSHKMAVMFHVHDFGLLIFIIATIGGLISGLSACSGALLLGKKS